MPLFQCLGLHRLLAHQISGSGSGRALATFHREALVHLRFILGILLIDLLHFRRVRGIAVAPCRGGAFRLALLVPRARASSIFFCCSIRRCSAARRILFLALTRGGRWMNHLEFFHRSNLVNLYRPDRSASGPLNPLGSPALVHHAVIHDGDVRNVGCSVNDRDVAFARNAALRRCAARRHIAPRRKRMSWAESPQRPPRAPQ